jgi:hypothetical protein
MHSSARSLDNKTGYCRSINSASVSSLQARFTSWCYISGALSYAATAVIILETGLPTSRTNFVLKGIYLAFYLFVIFRVFLRDGLNFPRSFKWFAAFFIIYSCRLVFDVSIRGVQFANQEWHYVYAYFFGATLVPCFALFMSARYINAVLLFWDSFLVVAAANLLLLYYLLTKTGQTSAEMIGSRVNIQSSNELGTDSTFINPILIGQLGAILLIFCSTLLFNRIKSQNFIWYIAGGLLGVYNIMISSSRGPFLLALTGVFVALIHSVHWNSGAKGYLAKLIGWLLLVVVSAVPVVSWLLANYEISMLQRMETFLLERAAGGREARDEVFADAWNQFISSPIFGDQFVVRLGGGYPHNIVVETLMATGLVGGSLFLGLLWLITLKVRRIMFDGYFPFEFMIISMACFFFLSGLTSGSIFVNPEIWLSLAVVLAMPISKTASVCTGRGL